jgi:hypothetical protein
VPSRVCVEWDTGPGSAWCAPRTILEHIGGAARLKKEVGAVSTLWERVKSGLTVAAREAEDLTRIGRLRLEMLTTQRTIDRTFSELGGRVYDLLTGESKKSIPADKKIKELIERIGQLERELVEKERELGRAHPKW